MRLTHAIAAIAAATTLVLSPEAAFASLPQPAVGDIDAPSVGYLVDVAESYWSPNACAGKTQVHTVSKDEAVAAVGDPRTVAFSAGDGSAFWPKPSCDIWIADDAFTPWPIATLCHAIVHEIGHDLGYDHTPLDPTNVMYPLVDTPGPAICDAAQARMTSAAPPAPTQPPAPIGDAPVVDIDDADPGPAQVTRWPAPRVLRIGRDAHGRVALRIANSASPQLTVRFYRASQTVLPGLNGQMVVKKVVARVDHAAFENAAASAVIVAPPRWDALDVQLTGGQLKPGTARWMPAQAVHEWRDARGPVSGQGAPSAGDEFGIERKNKADPDLTGCGVPLSC